MKSIFFSILLAFLFYTSIARHSHKLKSSVKTQFKAGFFTANIENQMLSEQEIKQAISSLPAEKNQNTNALTDYDVLFISLQEAKNAMKSFSFSGLTDYDCKTEYKTGITKASQILSPAALVSVVCFKNDKFEEVDEKNPAGLGKRLKGGVGRCIKAKTGENMIFCFIAAHLDTNPAQGSTRLKSLLAKIVERSAKKLNIQKENLKINVFVLGDWNLRVFPLYNQGKAVTSQEVEKLKGIFSTEMAQIKEGNTRIESEFKQIFDSQSNEFQVGFPESDLLTLDITYKYKSTSDELDFAKMADTKGFGEGKNQIPLNNFGWLDRLGCITKKSNSCRIENLKYNANKSLKKADHLPLSGSFVFYQE